VSYRNKFEGLVQELRSHPDIEVLVADFRLPATEPQIAAAKAYAPIPAVLEALYRETNGLDIEWRYTGTRKWHTPYAHGAEPYEAHPGGHIRIAEIEWAFSSQEGDLWGEGWDECKTLHPLDSFIEEAMVCMDLQPGGGEPQVVFYSAGEVAPMRMTVEEYFETLLWSRGFPYAAKVLSDDSGSGGLHGEAEFALCMPELFDDFDLNRYQRADGQPICPRLNFTGRPPPTGPAPSGLPPGANPNLPSVTFTVGGRPRLSKMVALLLAVFFGFLVTCGGCGLWSFIDIVLIAMDKLPDAGGRPLEPFNA